MTYWPTRVLVNWLVIALAFALALWSWRLLPVAWIVIGTRQHALSILGHDGTHWHVCKGAWNDRLSNVLCLWPINSDVRTYRAFHFAHHRYLGTDRDPETFIHDLCSDPRRGRRLVLDLCGFGLPLVVGALAATKPPLVVTLVHVLIAALFVYAGLWLIPVLWWGCLATSYWAMFRLRIYSEHIGANLTHRWTKPSLWRRWLYLPELTWLHYEHHAAPGVPLRAIYERES